MNKPTKHYGKWRIRWNDENGIRKSAVYDTYALAEHNLQKNNVEVTEIKLGIRQQRIPEKKFPELADYWMKNRATQKRSLRDDESILRAHLLPAFGRMTIAQINVAAVDQYKLSKSHLNPKTVNNHLTLLISLLNTARDLMWLTSVPPIKKPKITIMSFNYLKTKEECERFLNAANRVGEIPYLLYAVTMFTGLRAGEVACLQWDDIDFKRNLISVKRSYKGPTKSGEPRYVLIPNRITSLLREWRLKNPLPIVFPNKRGKVFGPSSRIFQEIFHKTIELGGFETKLTSRGTYRYIVFHDLRHTFASHWMMNRGEKFKLQKMMGHKQESTTSRYAHFSPECFSTEDYQRFGDFEKPGEIIPFRSLSGGENVL